MTNLNKWLYRIFLLAILISISLLHLVAYFFPKKITLDYIFIIDVYVITAFITFSIIRKWINEQINESKLTNEEKVIEKEITRYPLIDRVKFDCVYFKQEPTDNDVTYYRCELKGLLAFDGSNPSLDRKSDKFQNYFCYGCTIYVLKSWNLIKCDKCNLLFHKINRYSFKSIGVSIINNGLSVSKRYFAYPNDPPVDVNLCEKCLKEMFQETIRLNGVGKFFIWLLLLFFIVPNFLFFVSHGTKEIGFSTIFLSIMLFSLMAIFKRPKATATDYENLAKNFAKSKKFSDRTNTMLMSYEEYRKIFHN